MTDAKSRKISKDDVNERLKYGVCPVCGDYKLVKNIKMIVLNAPDTDKKFGGVYWACGSEKSHKCYYLSEQSCRESTAAEKIEEIKKTTKPTVILRKKIA